MSFKSATKAVAAKSGESMKNAAAMVAAGSRKASAETRREHPALNKVSGMPPMSKAPKGKK